MSDKAIPVLTLEEIESSRVQKTARIRVNNILFLVFPAIGIPTMVMINEQRGLFFLILMLLLLNLVRHLLSYFTNYNAYEIEFKHNALSQVVGEVFPGYRYTQNPPAPQAEIEQSGLFWMAPLGEVETTEQFSGNVAGQPFTITRMLGRIPASKSIQSDVHHNGTFITLVIPKKGPAASVPVYLATFGSASPAPRVEVPGFANGFSVYSESEMAAEILTPSRIEALLDLADDHRKVHASFVGGMFYLFVNGDRDPYAVGLRSSVTDPDQMRGMFGGLRTYTELLEKLV